MAKDLPSAAEGGLISVSLTTGTATATAAVFSSFFPYHHTKLLQNARIYGKMDEQIQYVLIH